MSSGFVGGMEALGALQQEEVRDIYREKESKEIGQKQLEMIDKAARAFDTTGQLIWRSEWKEAAQGMTQQGSDDFAIRLVIRSIKISRMELPPQMDTPIFKGAKAATTDVVQKYKLGGIDVRSLLDNQNDGRPNISDEEENAGEGLMTLQEKTKAQRDKTRAELLAAIDKNEQRWEIIAALRDAQIGSPFDRDVFNKRVNVDAEIDATTVFLTVTRDLDLQLAIPTVVKMTLEKGNWKYAGIDQPRTQKALREMVR